MALSVEQIMDCIENPVKTKIVMLLQEKGKATAKELLAANSDIPQATLYRNLKSMETAGIIEVVEETKVRAVTEKTYSISDEFINLENELLKDNDAEAYYRIFSGFVLGLLKKFEQYAKSANIDIAADGSGFNAIPIYATAEQLSECSREIERVLAQYTVKKAKDQKLHTFATIVTPPIE